MQIIINIPEDRYNQLMSEQDLLFRLDTEEYITDGTPLPKGHGKLIDADELEPDTEWDDYEDGFISYSRNQIKCANVIVPADKESD